MRRDTMGGKRGDGHAMQSRGEQVRRPDPAKIAFAGTHDRLTTMSGLVAFGRFLRTEGVDAELRRFNHLKTSPQLVYPMHAQMRLLLVSDVRGPSWRRDPAVRSSCA